MHPYATDSDERRLVPVLLVVSAILSTYGLAKAIDWSGWQAYLWWVEIPSVLGFYGFYWWLFDRWMWRWKWLRSVRLISVPDLNGNWQGHGVSSYRNEKGERTRFNIRNVEIRQRWTRLAVWLQADASRSHSLIGAVTVHDGQHPTLSYEYRNEPGQHAPETMHIHPGMARLEWVDETYLEGEYYTGRDRENYGTLHLRKR